MVWKYAGRYVLPFSPSSMKMDIRWNTALMDTISSVKTRSLSKEHPQFTVNYSALLKGAGLQFATDRVLRDLEQEVLIPMWQDVATERISDTEVGMPTTDKTFYKVGSLVMLWKSDTEWQIVEVEQVNPAYVKFGINSIDWVCVAPVEEGFMASSPSTSTDRNRNTKLNYSVTVKRLDGPLSTAGGGVIPGVYADTLIGNGVDSGVVTPAPQNLLSSFWGVVTYFTVNSLDTTQVIIYLYTDDAGVPSGTEATLSLFIRTDGSIGVYSCLYSSTTGYNSVVDSDVGVLEEGKTYRLQVFTKSADNREFDFYLNGLQINTTRTVGTLPSINPLQIPNNITIGISRLLGSSASCEIWDTYYSIDPNFALPSSIASYNEPPNTLEDNRPYYTGKELFTQNPPDVVPEVYNTFIGNGVDSGLDKTHNIGSSFASIAFDFYVTLDSHSGRLLIIEDIDNTNNYSVGLSLISNGRVLFFIHRSNTSTTLGITSPNNALTVGVKHRISVFVNVLSHTGGMFIDSTSVGSNLVGDVNTTPVPISSTINLGYGRANSSSSYSYIDGEISEFTFSDNPLAIDPSTIVQYATGQELFTQNPPDAPLSDWIGGATQGEIKQGWIGGAVQGTIEISPPSGAPSGPYPEDPKLTEVPIKSKKSNSYSLHLNTVKSVGGVVKVNSMRSVPTVSTTQAWDNQNRDEYLNMLDFLARCRGRKNAFDSASFKCDLALLTDAPQGGTYLDVADPGLQVLTIVGTRFTVIRGRAWSSDEVYEITDMANVAGGVRLSLDKALIESIFTSDTISNVRASRLASDSISIDIQGFTRSTASIAVRDINEGG